MTINIENESIHSDEFEVSLSKTYEEIIEEVIIDALDYEECPYEAAVEVLLTDDSEIHEINLEQREIDRATDVLSFPMVDYDEAGSFEGFDDRYELFDPDSGELMLGDIVISVEHVLSQAREYGHSTDRELAFLIAHSMLHLMGYDHMEDEERAEMERKQEEILLIHGYTR